MTTGKTIALTRQTFGGKVMSLLFNMLSRLVIAFLHEVPLRTVNLSVVLSLFFNFDFLGGCYIFWILLYILDTSLVISFANMFSL